MCRLKNMTYCIAGNFRGRKLAWILWFCGYLQKFSLQNLEVWHLWCCKSKQSVKVFFHENRIFHQFAKVFSLKSFLLYGKLYLCRDDSWTESTVFGSYRNHKKELNFCWVYWHRWTSLLKSASQIVLQKQSLHAEDITYRSVPQIRPPFCNLSLSTKRRGGLYTGCDNFSRDYALPSGHQVYCRWGVRAKRGVSPSAKRRDASGR